MPVVWIPALLRDLTGGADQVTVPGATVRQVIEQIEMRFPGMQERLCDGDRLRPWIVVVVDGAVSRQRMRQVLAETSEVHFLPTIGGGQTRSGLAYTQPAPASPCGPGCTFLLRSTWL